MYTLKQAEQLSRYYKDRILGKAINKKTSEALAITDLKIEELTEQNFDVVCYAKCSCSVGFFRDIRSAARELDLPAPSEVLENSRRQ
jgi:hypothetical protein